MGRLQTYTSKCFLESKELLGMSDHVKPEFNCGTLALEQERFILSGTTIPPSELPLMTEGSNLPLGHSSVGGL